MAEAAAAGGRTSISDALRSHIALDVVKPLQKPAPRRRAPHLLPAASGLNPELLREITAMGCNLNQIARRLNGQALAGQSINELELFVLLRSIERSLHQLASIKTPADRGLDAH